MLEPSSSSLHESSACFFNSLLVLALELLGTAPPAPAEPNCNVWFPYKSDATQLRQQHARQKKHGR